jgi:hypothetical protein
MGDRLDRSILKRIGGVRQKISSMSMDAGECGISSAWKMWIRYGVAHDFAVASGDGYRIRTVLFLPTIGQLLSNLPQLLDNLWPVDVFVCEFLDFSEFSVLV